MAHEPVSPPEPELSPEELALLQEVAERGYTPKRTVAEPDEAPGGPAGTSNGNED